MERPDYLVVIGTSAGGGNALEDLVSQLNQEMNASFFIVMHLGTTAISNYLVDRLRPLSKLPIEIAKDARPIERGRIYLAPPNEHLIIIRDQIVVGHGPQENRWRPSIDVLFRSAAAAYTGRVVGIILTGLLNDGTAGMSAIKRSGGFCIVQDPDEAEFPDMPQNVLRTIEVDKSIGISEMGNALMKIFSKKPIEKKPPEDVAIEAEIASNMTISLENVRRLGDHVFFACPDCGGGLYQISGDKVKRYRCHVGHVYEEEELLVRQGETLESTLWVALRIMEERHTLFRKIASDQREKGHNTIATNYQKSAEELRTHIENLKNVLIAIQNSQRLQA